MKRHEPYNTRDFFFEKHEISYALDGNDAAAMLQKCDQIRATTMSMTVVVEILRNYINRYVILHYLFAEQVFLNWKFTCVSMPATQIGLLLLCDYV